MKIVKVSKLNSEDSIAVILSSWDGHQTFPDFYE